eukprot:c20585_g5_i7.p1 GENE.c20585_g5_i7~~c20585_g5_i7.p1  ORF type:complete len:187 (+),score=16.05 c20585_g5_i7:746-1306(+)
MTWVGSSYVTHRPSSLSLSFVPPLFFAFRALESGAILCAITVPTLDTCFDRHWEMTLDGAASPPVTGLVAGHKTFKKTTKNSNQNKQKDYKKTKKKYPRQTKIYKTNKKKQKIKRNKKSKHSRYKIPLLRACACAVVADPFSSPVLASCGAGRAGFCRGAPTHHRGRLCQDQLCQALTRLVFLHFS